MHREPGDEGYGRLSVHGRAEALRPEAFADLEVAVSDVLPPGG